MPPSQSVPELAPVITRLSSFGDQKSEKPSITESNSSCLRGGRVVGFSRELTHGDRATLFLVDEGVGELYEFASDEGENSKSKEATRVSTIGDKSVLRIRMGTGLAGHVAATGETLAIPDAYEDARWAGKAMDKAHGYRTKQLLVCPINGPHGKARSA